MYVLSVHILHVSTTAVMIETERVRDGGGEIGRGRGPGTRLETERGVVARGDLGLARHELGRGRRKHLRTHLPEPVEALPIGEVDVYVHVHTMYSTSIAVHIS